MNHAPTSTISVDPIDLIAAYMAEHYASKRVALHRTSYEGDFEVLEFATEYELAAYCLDTQAHIWDDGKPAVSFDTDWCDFARDTINNAKLSPNDRARLIRETANLPSDLKV